MLDGPHLDAQAVRSSLDRELAAALLQDEVVQRAIQGVAQDGPVGLRRHLLARALRLTPRVAPDTHALLRHCIERLGVELDVELYVQASADFNAGCTSPEEGRVFVLVTSALLEAFEGDELTFVLGHELGHHLYAHHQIPMHLVQQRGAAPPALVLRLLAWLRHAEISADRAGLLCCGALGGAARSLFKLSSGLRQAPGTDQIEAFIEQSVEFYRESESLDAKVSAGQADWLSTHPFSPVRLRAAQAFALSCAFVPGGPSMARVDVESQELMALMEPSYLHQDTDAAEAMRRALFAAAVLVANADGDIADHERDALAELLGDRVPRELNPDALAKVLPERLERVNRLVPLPRRVVLVRDLASIARSDGHCHPEEAKVIQHVARALGVEGLVVDAALEAPVELD